MIERVLALGLFVGIAWQWDRSGVRVGNDAEEAGEQWGGAGISKYIVGRRLVRVVGEIKQFLPDAKLARIGPVGVTRWHVPDLRFTRTFGQRRSGAAHAIAHRRPLRLVRRQNQHDNSGHGFEFA